jgi:hypothetical protein
VKAERTQHLKAYVSGESREMRPATYFSYHDYGNNVSAAVSLR